MISTPPADNRDTVDWTEGWDIYRSTYTNDFTSSHDTQIYYGHGTQHSTSLQPVLAQVLRTKHTHSEPNSTSNNYGINIISEDLHSLLPLNMENE